jgi:hypothetical protein
MSIEKLREESEGSIGPLLKGQQWVELHGVFTYAQLMSLAAEIQKTGKGLGDVHQNRHKH